MAASTYFSNTPSSWAATAARIKLSVLTGKNGFQVKGLTPKRFRKRLVSITWNSRLFLMPASVSAGDLLLVALKMPPNRIGTYSNFIPIRCSIAGIASWLRKALGLPKSNMNCGAVVPMTASRMALWLSLPSHCGATKDARPLGSMTTVILWRSSIVQSRLGGNAIAESELDDVVADFDGPCGDQFAEAPPIVGKQRPRGLFESRSIAGHGRHEVIGRVARCSLPVAVAIGAPRLVDQFSQRDRRAAGPGVEPFPMPRQQRHLARDHAQFRTAAAARLARLRFRLDGRWRRLGEPGDDFLVRSAQVEIERAAGRIAENDDRRSLAGPLHRECDLGEGPRDEAPLALKGRETWDHLQSSYAGAINTRV